jgi:hypothetical protein
VAGAANAMAIFTANIIGWAVLISVLNFVGDYVFIGLCTLAARNLFKRYPPLTFGKNSANMLQTRECSVI